MSFWVLIEISMFFFLHVLLPYLMCHHFFVSIILIFFGNLKCVLTKSWSLNLTFCLYKYIFSTVHFVIFSDYKSSFKIRTPINTYLSAADIFQGMHSVSACQWHILGDNYDRMCANVSDIADSGDWRRFSLSVVRAEKLRSKIRLQCP